MKQIPWAVYKLDRGNQCGFPKRKSGVPNLINFRVRDNGRGQVDTLDINCLEPKKPFDQHSIKDVLSVAELSGRPSFCHSIRTWKMFDKMFRSSDKNRRADPYKREELLKWKELLSLMYKTRLPSNEESGGNKKNTQLAKGLCLKWSQSCKTLIRKIVSNVWQIFLRRKGGCLNNPRSYRGTKVSPSDSLLINSLERERESPAFSCIPISSERLP